MGKVKEGAVAPVSEGPLSVRLRGFSTLKALLARTLGPRRSALAAATSCMRERGEMVKKAVPCPVPSAAPPALLLKAEALGCA